jgi:hypothetical protein
LVKIKRIKSFTRLFGNDDVRVEMVIVLRMSREERTAFDKAIQDTILNIDLFKHLPGEAKA